MKRLIGGILIGIVLTFALIGAVVIFAPAGLLPSPAQLIQDIPEIIKGETRPPEGWEEPTEENYPYVARLAPELERKIEVRYTFSIRPDGYEYRAILTNRSDKGIISYSYELIGKDSDGNIITELGGGGVLSMSPPLAPGETTYFGGGADGLSIEGAAKIVLVFVEVGFVD